MLVLEVEEDVDDKSGGMEVNAKTRNLSFPDQDRRLETHPRLEHFPIAG